LSKANGLTREKVLGYISGGESTQQELKSSLFFDHKRHAVKPDTPTKELQSEGVTFACLKTMAAFLNSDGGRLIVGVRNDGTICGISDDFNFCQQKNIDGWELKLRDIVKVRFYEGDIVYVYVSTKFETLDGQGICVATIAKRSRLTFFKGETGRYCLFIRQGNITIELGIEQVEEYLEDRKRGEALPG